MKWTVILTRDITESTKVTVMADTEEQAKAAALEHDGYLEWAADDNAFDDPYVTFCEPRRV